MYMMACRKLEDGMQSKSARRKSPDYEERGSLNCTVREDCNERLMLESIARAQFPDYRVSRSWKPVDISRIFIEFSTN